MAFSTIGWSTWFGTRASRVSRDVERDVEPVLEARLLDVEVALEELDFLSQRDLLAVEFSSDIRSRSLSCVIMSSAARDRVHQRRDRVQRVEEEVRVQLHPGASRAAPARAATRAATRAARDRGTACSCASAWYTTTSTQYESTVSSSCPRMIVEGGMCFESTHGPTAARITPCIMPNAKPAGTWMASDNVQCPGSSGKRAAIQKTPGPSSSQGYHVANPDRMASFQSIGIRSR